MTPQEIFDTAYKGLAAQGRRSTVVSIHGTQCMYRGEGGSKCNVGFLITDKQAEVWEGMNVNEIVSCDDGVPFWMKDNIFLLQDLQEAHDKAADVNMALSAMRRLARRRKLTVPARNVPEAVA